MAGEATGRARERMRQRQEVARQQQVLESLRAGNPLVNPLSANPVEAFLQKIGGAKTGNFYPAELNGRNALVGGEGSWKGSGTPPINVGGQTLYPVQRGDKAIYVSSSETTPNNSFLRTSKKKEEEITPLPGVDGLDLNRPKPFAMTPEGQFERYFQTPEFDYVFGAGSRGVGAPKDASAMQELGNQLRAPEKDTNIASMYASQSALGRVNQDAIQNMYEGDENMQAWAKANPMLAQREYLKSEQRRASEIGNERERVQLDNPMGQEAFDLIKAKQNLLQRAQAKK